MANNLRAQVLGGAVKDLSGSRFETVGDVRKELGLSTGYTATVNGEPADDDQELNDYEFVAFAPSVKGGRA